MASSLSSPTIYGTCPASVERLLIQWHKELTEATKRLRPYEDLPYWYNEGANVMFFAQAATMLGFAVIQEYTVVRGQGHAKYTGRADLWCGDDYGNEYEIEFKQHWASIRGDDKTLVDNVMWYLNEAEKQLLSIVPISDRRPTKLAMVFIGPWVAESDMGDRKKLLCPFLDQFTRPEDYGSDFSIAFQPFGSLPTASDGYEYPAIVLLGKTV